MLPETIFIVTGGTLFFSAEVSRRIYKYYRKMKMKEYLEPIDEDTSDAHIISFTNASKTDPLC